MLTFMLRLFDQFAHHSLDDPDISIYHQVSDRVQLLQYRVHSLRSPPKALPARAIQKLVEKPTISNDMRVPAHPIRRTGFRPTRSDTPPQARPVKLSARAKEEMKMPAQKDALALSPMSKSLTITQAYGKHDASAIGSATRHIAAGGGGNHQRRVVEWGVGGMGMGMGKA